MFQSTQTRFPILQNKIRIATDRIPSVIISCSVLQNIAKYLQDEDYYNLRQIENADKEDVAGVEFAARVRQRGQERRDEIPRIIYNW